MGSICNSLFLFLAMLFPPAHAECRAKCDAAEQWQTAMFNAELPAGHAAHRDAQKRIDLWFALECSTNGQLPLNHRFAWFGWAVAQRIERGEWVEWR